MATGDRGRKRNRVWRRMVRSAVEAIGLGMLVIAFVFGAWGLLRGLAGL